MDEAQKNRIRIGGFLSFIGALLLITTFVTIGSFVNMLAILSTKQAWANLTDKSNMFYHSMSAPIAAIELLGGFVFAILFLLVLIKFYQKKTFAPKLIVMVLSAKVLFRLVLFIVTIKISNQLWWVNFDLNIIFNLALLLIMAPYFKLSTRVKQTFIC